MIDKYAIETEILKRLKTAALFTAAQKAFYNRSYDPAGKAIWMSSIINAVNGSEVATSTTMEEGTYILDFFIRVPKGSGMATLSAKEKAVGDLFDPRTAINTYFVLSNGTKVNISSVETLPRVPFDEKWIQATVRLNIHAYKTN